jgi:hypothetical protein
MSDQENDRQLQELTTPGLTFKYGDKEYRVAPLTLIGLTEFRQEVYNLIIESTGEHAQEMKKVGFPESMIEEEYKKGHEAASGPVLIDVGNPIALFAFIFVSLRTADSTITRELVRDMLRDPSSLGQLQTIMEALNKTKSKIEKK